MRLLLDTHTWLWQLLEPERLSKRASAALEGGDAEIHLSPLSIWETLLLAERGRVELDPDPVAWVREALDKSPLVVPALSYDVAIRSRQLPDFGSQDPIDRFLVATCLVERMSLVTKDRAMRRYAPLATVW